MSGAVQARAHREDIPVSCIHSEVPLAGPPNGVLGDDYSRDVPVTVEWLAPNACPRSKAHETSHSLSTIGQTDIHLIFNRLHQSLGAPQLAPLTSHASFK